MLRLRRAGNTIKTLAAIFVVAFLCAYARTYRKYGTPQPQTTASVARPMAQPASYFPAAHVRSFHRRQAFYRPARHTVRHARRTRPFYLASLRRIRRFFTRVLAA
jgi:hypothetical protein